MGIRKFNPKTAGTRFRSGQDFAEVTRDHSEKSLTVSLKRKSGRNNNGRITSHNRGGGHKKLYRIIDFKRDKHGVPAKVFSIEYDPYRSARIALLHYEDGEKRYILASEGLKVGDVVSSGPGSDIQTGNSLPIENIPVGTVIHSIELRPGGGAKLARSAGASAQINAKEGNYSNIKLSSGEITVPTGISAELRPELCRYRLARLEGADTTAEGRT